MYPPGWHLIPEQARIQLFMTLPTPTIGTSVVWIQFQVAPTGTMPPIVESARIPVLRFSGLQIQATLPVIGNVSNQDYLNMTA